jgi:hypothetical protein
MIISEQLSGTAYSYVLDSGDGLPLLEKAYKYGE